MTQWIFERGYIFPFGETLPARLEKDAENGIDLLDLTVL